MGTLTRAALPYRPDLEDRWRTQVPSRTPSKEWQHVVLFGDGFELIVNFSLQTAEAPGDATGRVIFLLREREWTGWIETAAEEHLVVSDGGRRLSLGRHTMLIDEAGYRVVLNAPERDLFVNAAFEPVSVPMIARRHWIARQRRLDWVMVPRLVANGEILLDGRSRVVDGAIGYHDHNWGGFRWGDDVSWLWALVVPDEPDVPWTAVFSSLRDGAGGRVTLQQAFLWCRALNVLAASGADTRVRAAGSWRRGHVHRMPPALGLARQAGDVDVPTTVSLRADHPTGWVEIDLDVRSVSQILVPSEVDPLGVAVFTECATGARVRSRIDGTDHD